MQHEVRCDLDGRLRKANRMTDRLTTNHKSKAKPSWAIAYAKTEWRNHVSARLTKLNRDARFVDHLTEDQKAEARLLAAAIRGMASALEEATGL